MKLADTQAIAVLTGRPPSTIRRWARNGWLERRGTGPHGRAMYSPAEAAEVARLHPQFPPAGCTCDPPSHSGHYSCCPLAAVLLDNGPDMGEHQNDSAGSVP